MKILTLLFDLIKSLIVFIICAVVVGIIYYNFNLPLLPAIACPIFITLAEKFNIKSLKILCAFAVLTALFGTIWYGIAIWGTIAHYPLYGNWLSVALNIPTLLAFASFAFTLPLQILSAKY